MKRVCILIGVLLSLSCRSSAQSNILAQTEVAEQVITSVAQLMTTPKGEISSNDDKILIEITITPTNYLLSIPIPTIPMLTPEGLNTEEALSLVKMTLTKDGITLDQHTANLQQIPNIQYFGWKTAKCVEGLCNPSSGILISFRFLYDQMESQPLWLVENSNVYSINGKAKGMTPQLPNAFSEGKISDIKMALNLTR